MEKTDLKTEVGKRIQTLIKTNNMKQADICKKTGLSPNAVSNYVNGNRLPDTLSLFKIASMFEVSMEWLLTGDSARSPASLDSSKKLSNEEQQIIDLIRRLPSEEDKKEVVSFIKFKLWQNMDKKQNE